MTVQPPITRDGEHLQSLRRKHIENAGYGANGTRFAALVKAFSKEIGAATALDYACGKGQLADALVGDGTLSKVHKYDLGIAEFSMPCPEHVDLAICNHALYEFAPEHFVASLRYLRDISTLGAFISFQWGQPHQGGFHWVAPMQDADWVYGALRQYWPCHRVLDSGPVSTLRQFVFMGFVETPRWN